MNLPSYIPTVAVNLDKPRRLALTFRALRRIELVTGSKLEAEQGPPQLLDIAKYVWAALVEEEGEPALTLEDVELLIYMGNVQEISEAFRQLQELSETPRDSAGKAPVVVQMVSANP